MVGWDCKRTLIVSKGYSIVLPRMPAMEPKMVVWRALEPWVGGLAEGGERRVAGLGGEVAMSVVVGEEGGLSPWRWRGFVWWSPWWWRDLDCCHNGRGFLTDTRITENCLSPLGGSG